ncbi:hypothetical protein [Clostridium sp. DMHC 10]|uniref:hypothetical protein n=1 Tax=Clostridium sp. DMHC 10 TaxID=747377 RepID=UPI001FA79CC4|nr:hypothetical protein [Clostridium sp. DMHC 10]
MYNVTQDFLNTIKQNGRQFKGSVTVRDTSFDDSSIVEIDLEENVKPILLAVDIPVEIIELFDDVLLLFDPGLLIVPVL